MSCKKKYTYEFIVVLEEEFADVETAANQLEASDKAKIAKISQKRLLHSNIKLKEENGLQPIDNKGSSAKGEDDDKAS